MTEDDEADYWTRRGYSMSWDGSAAVDLSGAVPLWVGDIPPKR